jgi:hypothetical protein
MKIRRETMKINSGRVINLKFAANSGPDSIMGRRAVTNIMTVIIMLNAIIRYLNFNANSPIITHRLNHKRKIPLRQRYDAPGGRR